MSSAPTDERFLREADRDLTGWDDPAARLADALRKDELALFCQPILALAGGSYPLAEVLVRLREEESALLPPGEFLPVFEHYRMMPQLDRWVVRKVVERLARGSKVPRFSVNLSGQTLADSQFPGFVATLLATVPVPAAALLFEIDESDLLASPAATAAFCAAAKALGAGIMIDSFGRRAASFSPLKSLRADFIKVDGSLTRRVLSSEGCAKKIQAIVRFSDAMGVGVVAECVEEQDILLRLKAFGVTHAQGFGVYRPHPIDAIAG